MSLSNRLLSTLSMVVLLSGSNLLVAQTVEKQSTPKPAAVPATEWDRIKEGLRKAKPMPDSPNVLRPNGVTMPGGTMEFDAKTGHTFAPPATPRSLFGVTRAEPNPGAEPTVSGGSVPQASEPGHEGKSSPTGRTAGGVSPASVTPPSPYTTPYGFPFRTYGRLLLRFNDGTNDYYYLCSASIAASHHMVSAGHCVYNHDIRNDGSNIAGFAAEVWGWVAETDVVDPVDHDNWPDFPYGVAKMTQETTYNAWINNSDLNWDFSFLNFDRRIGDHLGWIGREWNTTTSALNFDGYPAQAPYVPSNNPFQYPGYDAGNVSGYTCCRIQMNAYTYGGHSGGPVWRYDSGSGNRYLEGVNSTSNRTGYAEATLLTSSIETDLESHIANDAAATDLAQVIENVFDGSEKGLGQTSTLIGYSFPMTLNAFNAGYTDAGSTYADIYLTTDPNNVAGGTYIGNYSFGDLGAYTTTTQSANITVPTTVLPGTYYVGYVLGAANAQYNTDKNSVVIEAQTMQAYCNADAYEPDNSAGQASTLPVGGSQAHSICNNNSGDPRTDQDWAKFTLTSSSSATLATAGFAGGDTTMTLYNSSLSQIDFNDDNGANLYSTINRTCASNPLPAGTYYVVIQSYANRTTIPNYTLSLSASACPVTSTTTLTASATSSVYGQAVTYTATVGSGSGTPTGSVTFYDSGVNVGTATIANGKAALNLILNAGSHSMVATYNAIAPWTSSSSAALTSSVTAAATTTAVVSSLNPSTYGQTITYTATITPAFGGAATGTVTFKLGSAVLGTGTVSANKATFSIATLNPNASDYIVAAYGGGANTLSSTSPILTQVVRQATSTTVLTSSVNPSPHGQTVILSAHVAYQYGGTFNGSVTFKDGTTTLGTAQVNSTTGVAIFPAASLALGSHSMTAIYGGNADVLTSTSPVLTQVVNKAATTTALVSAVNPSTWLRAVPLTATVSSSFGTIAGTVTFMDGSTTLGTATISGGKATFSTTALAVGSHSLSAVYSGSADTLTSTSATLALTVNKAATTMTVASSLNPAVYGQSVTLTASLTGQFGGPISGTVTFKDSSTVLGTPAINTATNKATLTVLLRAGTHSIQTTYAGNADYNGSVSPGLSQVVSQATSTTALSSSANPATHGSTVTFTAKITPAQGSVATGTVTFKDGSTTLGTGSVTASNTATFSTTALAVGTHSISAVYGGDGNVKTSTSNTVSEVIH